MRKLFISFLLLFTSNLLKFNVYAPIVTSIIAYALIIYTVKNYKDNKYMIRASYTSISLILFSIIILLITNVLISNLFLVLVCMIINFILYTYLLYTIVKGINVYAKDFASKNGENLMNDFGLIFAGSIFTILFVYFLPIMSILGIFITFAGSVAFLVNMYKIMVAEDNWLYEKKIIDNTEIDETEK